MVFTLSGSVFLRAWAGIVATFFSPNLATDEHALLIPVFWPTGSPNLIGGDHKPIDFHSASSRSGWNQRRQARAGKDIHHEREANRLSE